MAFDRNPRFYGELKQTNEDILKIVQVFHKKSPYFDYTVTFQDYIKQVAELKSKFPVVGTQPAPFFIPDTTTESDSKQEPTGGEEEAEEDSAPPQPNVDKFEEPDSRYQARCKLYERLIGNPNVSSSHAMLGCGSLFVKQLETPTKLHLIVRQDPDLRKVLLNQVITASTPLRLLAKAIQLIVPGEDGKTSCYIVKVKDDKVASELHQMLTSVRDGK
jgi:hypothetical protein